MTIRFELYKNKNGWNKGLELALMGVSQANLDLGVLQETKFRYGV